MMNNVEKSFSGGRCVHFVPVRASPSTNTFISLGHWAQGTWSMSLFPLRPFSCLSNRRGTKSQRNNIDEPRTKKGDPTGANQPTAIKRRRNCRRTIQTHSSTSSLPNQDFGPKSASADTYAHSRMWACITIQAMRASQRDNLAGQRLFRYMHVSPT